jgi:sugar lactone lactonase YvrE
VPVELLNTGGSSVASRALRYREVAAVVAVVVVAVLVSGGSFVGTPPGSLRRDRAATDGNGARVAASAGAGAALPAAPSQPVVFAEMPGPGVAAAVAVAADGTIWLGLDQSTGVPTELRQLDARGSLIRTVPLPQATTGITALAVGADGVIYAGSRSPAAVLRLDPRTDSVTVLAAIPDLAHCAGVVTGGCDASAAGGVPVVSSLAVTDEGTVFVADPGQGTIWRVGAGGQPEQWTSDRTWVNATRPSGPTALAFDGAGDLVIAVASLLVEDIGVLYLQAIEADGAAGERQELARTGPETQPRGLAVGASGQVYVTLSGSGRVLVLAPDGASRALVPAPSGDPLSSPAGMAFDDEDVVVVARPDDDAPGVRAVRITVHEQASEQP